MRRRVAAAAASLLFASGGAGAASDPARAPTRTFSNVTAAALACVADRSRKRHGTLYTRDVANPNRVTSETHYFGLTRIVYDFDPAARTVTYHILQKPGLASYDQVWDGIRDAITDCS